MTLIPLTPENFAIVDPEDVAFLSQWKWQFRSVNGCSYVGDENKLASDIKFEVHLSNTILDEFDKGLKAALYREVRKGEQPDLIGDNKFAAVRFPLLDGFRWEEEFTGYKVSIASELGLVEPLELSDITLKKFAFDPKEGGSVVVTFNAIAHPTSDEAGELCALIQEHVNLTLIAPQAAEQKKAA